MKTNIYSKTGINYLRAKELIVTILLVLPFLSFGQFPYSESFKNATASAMNFSGVPAAASLTSGVSDPAGDGYLMLTSNKLNQAGTVFSTAYFPSNMGLVAEFEYYMYGGTALSGKTGDGFSFFLFDGSVTTANFRNGAYGGALGYAQRNSPTVVKGVSKGYIGIGFDAFGNFSNPKDGRNGGPGVVPGAVVVRGPGDGSSLTKDYPWVTSQATNVAPFNFALTTPNRQPFPTSPDYRKARIEMTPIMNGTAVTGFTVTVKITVGGDTPTTYTVINNKQFNYAPPPYLKFGFAGSTGGASNYHEIRNFTIDVKDPNGLATPTVNDDNYTSCLNSTIHFDPTVNDETPNDGNLSNPGVNINKATIDFDGATAGLQQTKTIDGKGVFTADANGVVTFTPEAGFSGTVDCQYYVTDFYGKVAANPGTIHVNVTNNAAPALTINSPQTTCSPSAIDLTASPNVWSATPNGGTAGYFYDILADSAIKTPSSITANGTYYIQYTDASNGCTVIKPVDVTISGATNTPTAVNNFNCGPGAVSLSATGAGAGEDYKWYDAASGGNLVQTNGNTFTTPSINATTNYWVSKYNLTTAGCESNRVLVAATINAGATTADAGTDQTLSGDATSISLTGNAPANSETGAWTFVSGPNTPTILNPTNNNVSVNDIVPGTYMFRWTIQRATCTSSDDVQVTVASILPVTLVRFDGTLRNKTVSLTWATATELNNDHFEVESSTDGTNFSDIAKISYVKGNGTSNAIHNYSYQDNVSGITQPAVYYRLKQVDFDGKSSYSRIVAIHLSNASLNLLMFPNPFKSNVRMQATFATAGNVTLVVTDINGKIVNRQNLTVNAGFNDIAVKGLQSLNAGIYSVEIIQDGKKVFTTRLVKQ
jgi:hypothetical protein